MQTKPPLTLSPGILIDQRYRLEACIGEGGFASVYRARHIHMDRLAALKILHSQGSGPQAQQFEARFILEAQALARLNHPNIVSVYDFGFHGQERLPYLAMELLDGCDLEAELQRGPLSFSRVKHLLLPVLAMVRSVFEAGVVQGNVM